jgi:hypothetical protein
MSDPTSPLRVVPFPKTFAKSTMQVTTIEQLLQAARERAQQQQDRRAPFHMVDVGSGHGQK